MNRATRFIKIANDYINYNNILRMSVDKAKANRKVNTDHWRVNLYLLEADSDAFNILGTGCLNGSNKSYYWTFNKEDEAHAFVKKILGDKLDL